MNHAREFFGRIETLDALADHLQSVERGHGGRIVTLRGRRQVGKSSVVERFVERGTVPYVFVTGVFRAPATAQLADATSALVESQRPVVDADLLAQSPATSWRDWFSRLAVAARSGPVVAVLDEFPWMIEQVATLEGELQASWDRTLQKLPILLILIGSDVAMMDSLARHGRPLFGRVSPLVVPALNPAEVSQALGTSASDAFDAYLVTGGYPRLVTDLATSGAGVHRYVTRALQDEFSPLVTTGRLTLDAEFPEPQAAYQVLSAIGSSDVANPGFMDVLGAISDPSERANAQTAATRALSTLTNAKALIEREQPAWAAPTSKLRRYRVTDPYLRFWFRYVERNVDRIARGRADLAVAAFERDWETWRGHSVEPVVRQALTRLARTDPRLVEVETVLPWWTRASDVEVDVVASGNATTAMVGTIKWRTRGEVTSAEVAQLRRHRALIPHADSALVAAISPNGGAVDGVDVSYDAADLLTAWR
ncbi:ATP-binding protein [Cellulomonas soli]|uniref:ArsR family transcriptional regulator n=1 Tax=Cellulomonas soli TaxID=931535 RepID=A0A512PIV6_9CELL|nr:ATP-binding protein [Cellulomonas soli]NYI58235.1 hypothetical protein [Cellulomonas soli]GEP71117.1 ArsR family transcriptional regulator [Cellulomonas soli]